MKIYKIRDLRNGKFANKSGITFTKTGDVWHSKKRCCKIFCKACEFDVDARDFLEIVSFNVVEDSGLMCVDLFEMAEHQERLYNGKIVTFFKMEPKEGYDEQLKNF